MSNSIFYATTRKQDGPVSLAELRVLAAKGEFRRTDKVWREGMAEWMPATAIPEIFASLQPDMDDGEAPPGTSPKSERGKAKPSANITNASKKRPVSAERSPEAEAVPSGLSAPSNSNPKPATKANPPPSDKPLALPKDVKRLGVIVLASLVCGGSLWYLAALSMPRGGPKLPEPSHQEFQYQNMSDEWRAGYFEGRRQGENRSFDSQMAPWLKSPDDPYDTLDHFKALAERDGFSELHKTPTDEWLAGFYKGYMEGWHHPVSTALAAPVETRTVEKPAALFIECGTLGATVRIDDGPALAANQTITGLPVNHSFTVIVSSIGHETFSTNLTLLPADNVRIGPLTLRKLFGTVTVMSNPQGALVDLDGQTDPDRITPCRIPWPLEQDLVISLQLSGYDRPPAKTIRLTSEVSSARIDFGDLPHSEQVFVTVSPPQAEVLFDEVSIPGSNGVFALRGTLAGLHTVRVQADGYSRRTETLEVRTGQKDLTTKIMLERQTIPAVSSAVVPPIIPAAVPSVLPAAIPADDPKVLGALQLWMAEVMQFSRNPKLQSPQLLTDERAKIDRYAAAHGPIAPGSQCAGILNQIHVQLDRMQNGRGAR